MKYKITRDSGNNTMSVHYNKVKEKQEFRYEMQYRLIEESQRDVYVFIDTNSTTGPGTKRISAMLDDMKVDYVSYKIKATQSRLLGMLPPILGNKKTKMSQRMYIIKVDKDNYTKELFMQALCTYDIAIGFGPSMGMEELHEEYHDEVHSTFFDSECYDDFVYDSILFSIFRSTIDVENNARELER